MKDPERLLQRPPNDFTANLLRAGAEEKPSSAALRRTLQVAAVGTALGVSLQASSASAAVVAGAKSGMVGLAGGAAASGAVVGGAAGAGVAAAGAAAGSAATGNGVVALTAAAIAKWVGVGAIGGVMAATAAHRLAPGSLSAVSVTRSTPSAQVEVGPPRPPQLAPRRAAGAGVQASFADANPKGEAVAEPSPRAAADPVSAAFPASDATAERAPSSHVEPRAPVRGSSAPSAGRARVASSPSLSSGARASAAPVLAAEVAMVDRGRAALQRGDGAGALQALAGYEAAFPKQQLSPEVLFLRMEALARIGDLAGARVLAQRIVARGTAGPQAVRARELLGQ